MKDRRLSAGEHYVKKNRFRRKWYRLMLALSSVVVFVITYAMILPAITLEQAEALAVTEPMKVEDYVTDAKLFYRETQTDDWMQAGDAPISGSASFKLDISYGNVPVETLLAADGMMTYTLPEIFRDAQVNGQILSSGETAGTMEVNEGTVTLRFAKEWLAKLLENKKTVLENGSLEVIASANLSKIDPSGNEKLVIGDLVINVNFTSDLIAQYGTVSLEKTLIELIETEEGDFLKYTLKVTAGADGCPEVRVEDSISAGAEYAEGYVKESFLPADENVTLEENESSQKLIWTLGSLEPNALRELTYQIKLKDDYLGVKAKNPMTNIAAVYSKDYKRAETTAAFTPQAGATLSKVAGEYIKDPQGNGGVIRYTVWVKALDSNNYTLKNVTVQDALDGTVSGGYKTDEKLLPYLSYDENEFRLYEGGSDKQNGGDGLEEISGGLVSFAENGKSFHYNVGALKPGECKTLVYTIRVSEGIYTVTNEEEIKINNRATIMTDPNRTDGGGQRLNSYNCSKTISAKKWARKLLGERVETTQTVTMEDGASFEIPAGSYEYQIVVNEAGDWDVSSAVFKDSLQSQHMQYVGYLRIDAYEGVSAVSSGTDPDDIEKLQGKNLQKTKWIDIGGKTSFEITPEKAGFSSGENAYLLTYYAVPVNMSDISSVIVSNSFWLEGTVAGNGKYVLSGIWVEASVILEGANYFSAEKKFWYYDAGKEEKGTLYWILKISGSMLPKGTQFKDLIKADNHQIGAVVKAFTAETQKDFSEAGSLNALGNVTGFTAFSTEPSDIAKELILTLTEDVVLQEENSLYFVISTVPQILPEQMGSYEIYQNKLETKDPAETANWVSQSEAGYTMTVGGNIYKKLGMVFTAKKNAEGQITENEVVRLKEPLPTGLQYDHLTDSGGGTYAAWMVTINSSSELSGRYRIREQIPEGMEVVYIQQYSSPNYSKRPWFVDQNELEGYTKVIKTYSSDYDKNPITAYYYMKGQEVLWDVDGLQAAPQNPNTYQVTFLVVCRLTDEEVLLGGETKIFNNQVSILNTAGTELGNASDSVELKAETLSKTGVYNANVNGGRYPFKITVNENGTDLVQESDEIRLVDEMCEYLILDPSSIHVVHTVTGEEASYSSQLDTEKNILTLTLPDDQPLTITYEASINAAPGQKINISNKAYWYSYVREDQKVENEDFSYAVGGTVEAGTTPKVTIIKRDQYKNQTLLAGAEFSLQEMKLSEGGLIEAAEGIRLTGTTGDDGTLRFGTGETLLKFNTVYRLTETKAPEGYVKEEAPHDFLIAKKENGAYPEELELYQKQNVMIYYGGADYSVDIYNHKGEILVTKKFADAEGKLLSGSLSGTYQFGLYEADSQSLIQTTEIRFQKENGTLPDGTAKFTNIEFGRSYVVYELDDQGNPIRAGGAAVISGIPFTVSYENASIMVTAAAPSAEVTITNRMNYAELPASGGYGAAGYTAGGALLTMSAAGLLCHKLKRKRRTGSSF